MDYLYSSVLSDGVKNDGESRDVGGRSHIVSDGSVTLRGGSDA